MSNPISSDIAFTPAVKAMQFAKGSRAQYAQMEEEGGWSTLVTLGNRLIELHSRPLTGAWTTEIHVHDRLGGMLRHYRRNG